MNSKDEQNIMIVEERTERSVIEEGVKLRHLNYECLHVAFSTANFLKLRIGDMVFVDITLLTPSSAIIRTQSKNNNQRSGLTAFMGFHYHFHISILL